MRPSHHDSRPAAPSWRSRRAPAVQAAVAVGLPLAVFSLAGDVRSGGFASLGALAAVYAAGLAARQRAARVAGVGVGLVLAMVAGTVVAGSRLGAVAAIALVAGIAVLVCRWRCIPPPGALMPVLVCATATQIPLDSAPLGPRLGLVVLGAAIAWVVVMVGSAFRAGTSASPPPHPPPHPPWPQIVRAAARGALGTSAAALVALTVGLPRPDWAAVACAAVLLNDASRATLRRAGHRAVGTAVGIGLAGVVLAVAPSAAAVVVLVIVFQFVVEMVVARNYALAVVFITPLALLQGALAAGQLHGPIIGLLAGRLVETALGCVLAVVVQAVLPPPGERLATRLLRETFRVAPRTRAPSMV